MFLKDGSAITCKVKLNHLFYTFYYTPLKKAPNSFAFKNKTLPLHRIQGKHLNAIPTC